MLTSSRTRTFSAFCLSLAAVLGLAACSVENPDRGVDPTTQGQPVPSPEPAKGTVDGGGGNGVKGRPLESYMVDLSELEIYGETIYPRILNLAKSFPPLAADFLHLIRQRNWFMIPVDLNAQTNPLGVLPPWKIGTYFVTEQLALQNLKEVWIDTSKYDPMEPGDKARILIHELVMGVRLLKHQGSVDRCVALATQKLFPLTEDEAAAREAEARYQEAKKECFEGALLKNPSLAEDRFDLSKNDYANIRYLTRLISDPEAQLDNAQLKSWMKIEGFRDYPDEPVPENPPKVEEVN